jgi:hypothetical protein
MIARLLIALLLGVSCAEASPGAPARLQCDGKLSKMKENGVAIRGVHLEVGAGDVKLDGAQGLSGTYKITQNSSGGVGFQADRDPGLFGYLNRSTGKLSLSQKGEGERIAQWFAGDCTAAK